MIITSAPREVYLCVGFVKCDSSGRTRWGVLSVRRLIWSALRPDGVSYWLLSILYDFYPVLMCMWVLKQIAICWLLWAGWVCYIFTVSVMINFFSPPHSLKQPSVLTRSLLPDFPPHQLTLFLSYLLFICLACFFSQFHLVFFFRSFPLFRLLSQN